MTTEELVNILGRHVSHPKFGDGTIISLEGEALKVQFKEKIGTFLFPEAIGTFLQTSDTKLLDACKEERNRKEKEKIAQLKAQEIEREKERQARLAALEEAKANHNRRTKTSNGNGFDGSRSHEIRFRNAADLYTCLGYMAAPNRIKSIDAEVPEGEKLVQFKHDFPGQPFLLISNSKTPSGIVNKVSAQFRINFLDITNCPDTLKENMGKGVGKIKGRINKSSFVLEIVRKYCFSFGDEQNFELIKQKAEKAGYLEAFLEGVHR